MIARTEMVNAAMASRVVSLATWASKLVTFCRPAGLLTDSLTTRQMGAATESSHWLRFCSSRAS